MGGYLKAGAQPFRQKVVGWVCVTERLSILLIYRNLPPLWDAATGVYRSGDIFFYHRCLFSFGGQWYLFRGVNIARFPGENGAGFLAHMLARVVYSVCMRIYQELGLVNQLTKNGGKQRTVRYMNSYDCAFYLVTELHVYKYIYIYIDAVVFTQYVCDNCIKTNAWWGIFINKHSSPRV